MLMTLHALCQQNSLNINLVAINININQMQFFTYRLSVCLFLIKILRKYFFYKNENENFYYSSVTVSSSWFQLRVELMLISRKHFSILLILFCGSSSMNYDSIDQLHLLSDPLYLLYFGLLLLWRLDLKKIIAQ